MCKTTIKLSYLLSLGFFGIEFFPSCSVVFSRSMAWMAFLWNESHTWKTSANAKLYRSSQSRHIRMRNGECMHERDDLSSIMPRIWWKQTANIFEKLRRLHFPHSMRFSERTIFEVKSRRCIQLASRKMNENTKGAKIELVARNFHFPLHLPKFLNKFEIMHISFYFCKDAHENSIWTKYLEWKRLLFLGRTDSSYFSPKSQFHILDVTCITPSQPIYITWVRLHLLFWLCLLTWQ